MYASYDYDGDLPQNYKYTGKERDSESGLDNFGARYDASSLGRFMSPDPGNVGVNRLNPQSWNAYSYSLNNPLNLTDPTGLYVCEDSTKCDSKNDQAFAKSLADAQTAANNLTGDDKAAAQRAIDSYGAQGVDNGVNVRFDANVTGGVTEVSGGLAHLCTHRGIGCLTLRFRRVSTSGLDAMFRRHITNTGILFHRQSSKRKPKAENRRKTAARGAGSGFHPPSYTLRKRPCTRI